MHILKNKLKFCLLTLFLLITFAGATTAHAQKDQIRKRFDEHVAPAETIKSIQKTRFADLYEVQIENRIVYTDSKARYLFLCRIFDIESKQDFTGERLEEVNRVPFSDLPLDQAIKIVNGEGQRAIAVFSDPNCIYCKQLDKMLKDIDNLTIYVFPLNILGEKSHTVSRNIWCSPNQGEAWMAWMTRDRQPAQARSDCVYSDKDISELATRYGITGTPVILFQDGSRISGLPPAERFNQVLSGEN